MIKINNLEKPRLTSMILVVALLVLALLPSDTYAAGQTCTLSEDCPFGEICGGCPEDATCPSRLDGFSGGQCTPCKTSAECVQKTFEKSVPYLGAVSPWVTISILAVSIALLGSGIVYVIGHSFNIPRIKRVGKAELFQAIASLILIAMLFGTEQFEIGLIEQAEKTTGAITAAIYNPTAFSAAQAAGEITANPFEISYAFMRKLIDCWKNQYEFTYSASVAAEYIANLRLHFSVKVPVIKHFRTPIQPLALVPSFSKTVAEKEYLADELTWLMIVLYAQLAIMKFVEASMFTIFLPIGIILRSFPPTRGAGAVLMSIAIGLYIIYPLVFTILYVGTPPVLDGCDVHVPANFNQIERTCPLAAGSTETALGQAQTTNAAFETDIPKIKSGTSSLRFAAFLYMIISLGATFIFVRSISGVLGANISEIGRSMFRML